MPIQPAEPKRTQNRIFNKFEPQSPPRIAGIKPPRSSFAGGKEDKKQKELNRTTSSSPRLQRKVIIPTEQLDFEDDDEDLVRDEPGENATATETSEDDEHNPPTVVEENFVANVLADMSDMVLNLTADATEAKEGVISENVSGRSSPHSFDEKRASSPVPDVKKVQSEPNPEENEDKTESSTVIVEGGHLGGMANVAFEEEEGQHQDEGQDESDKSEIHFADVGYKRDRDMSNLLAQATENVAISPAVSENGDPDQQPQMETLAQTERSKSEQLPILFFIHGVAGSASTWTNQLKFFQNVGFEVVAPDLLGHGFSSAPDNAKCYTFKKLFGDLLTLFDHYVTCHHRSAVLIGHSYGCSFASALARSRPNHVIQLCLLASGGPTPLAPPPQVSGIWMSSSSAVSCLVKPLLKCGFLKQKKYNPRGKAIKFQEAYDVPSYVFKHIMNGQHWPEGDIAFHRRITVPTLLVYGLKDPFVSLVEMCEMERTIPFSYLELIPLAGHMIMFDRPKELNAMLKRFIFKYLEQNSANQQQT